MAAALSWMSPCSAVVNKMMCYVVSNKDSFIVVSQGDVSVAPLEASHNAKSCTKAKIYNIFRHFSIHKACYRITVGN